MKVWLYYRLSRDEDEELNSLNNQRKIIYNFAVSNGHQVVGESFDDNVSGMHFNREGIDKIYEVVEAGKIEAIIVKDLSRLGRHRTQTALFIDYLRERNVRVLSATENIDTFNENDDLIIGFKGLVNDFYARDGSRRVRTGYRQKQKEGIVTIPPFGYFKDKNTKKVVEFLANHPQVEKVNHPSLPDHPDHALYEKYFPNGGASIFTFNIKGGQKEAFEFIDHLQIFSLLANVADVKSLVIHPATTTHGQLSDAELADVGIGRNTIRLSIGTEHVDDIIADLAQALDAVE